MYKYAHKFIFTDSNSIKSKFWKSFLGARWNYSINLSSKCQTDNSNNNVGLALRWLRIKNYRFYRYLIYKKPTLFRINTWTFNRIYNCHRKSALCVQWTYCFVLLISTFYFCCQILFKILYLHTLFNWDIIIITVVE